MTTIESLDRSPIRCRAFIEGRLSRRAPRALERLTEARAFYPRLEVLPEDRARVSAAYDHGCVYCGAVPTGADPELATDFVVPPARGGTIQPENLLVACETCRRARRGVHLDVFLERRPDLDRRGVLARIVRATARLRAASRGAPDRR